MFLIIIATRPCYIKLASLIAALQARDIPFLAVESGQHYDIQLTGAKHEFAFEHLIGVSLNVQGPLAMLGAQLYERVALLSDLLGGFGVKRPPIPIVSGDTITAGLLPQAWYLHTGVRSLHIEAGLRTFGPLDLHSWKDHDSLEAQRFMHWRLMEDEPFPESFCSRAASAASQFFFAPVERNRESLIREGVDGSRIFVVGSLSADAVALSQQSNGHSKTRSGDWIRVDLHRRENMTVDRLSSVLGGLVLLNSQGLRTALVLSNALRGALDRFGLWTIVDEIRAAGGIVEDPWPSYRSVIEFMKSDNCLAVYTDSGGLQEEACILGARLFTCRYGTDRPETVLDFEANLLIPPISAAAVALGLSCALSSRGIKRKRMAGGVAPYGVKVGDTIAKILERLSFQTALPGASATHRGR